MAGKISTANRALILLLLAIAILLTLFFVSMDTQLEQRAAVEQRIGAGIESPYFEAGGRLTEVIAFMSVKPDGAAAQAGIKEGDIVIEDVWFGELCDRFAGPAGTIVSVEVVTGGDGPAIAERSRRTVAIRLP